LTDVHELASMARAMGGRRVTVGGDRVRTTCLLAHWNHSGGQDEHPSMVLFPHGTRGDPIYKCLGCHESGSVVELLQLLWMRTKIDTLGWIEMMEGTSIQMTPEEEAEENKKSALRRKIDKIDVAGIISRFQKGKEMMVSLQGTEMPELPSSAYSVFEGDVPRYAMDRGLTLETCQAWNLGHDKRHSRLMIPKYDRKGRLVATSGRLYACPRCGASIDLFKRISKCQMCGSRGPGGRDCCGEQTSKGREYCGQCHRETPPKYMHSKGFKRNLILFGENRTWDKAPDGRVYVVEGQLDAIRLWQLGYAPVVAILGSDPSKVQVEKLIRYYDRIIVVSDGDRAGEDMGRLMKQRVGDRSEVSVKKMPDGEDPGSASEEDIAKALGEPTRCLTSVA